MNENDVVLQGSGEAGRAETRSGFCRLCLKPEVVEQQRQEGA